MSHSRLFKLYEEDRKRREGPDKYHRPVGDYLEAIVEDFAEKSKILDATITIINGVASVDIKNTLS